MRPPDLLRTSSFRVGLLFMGLFGLGSLILFGTIYLETASYLRAQSRTWLIRETDGQVHSTEAGRIAHLDSRLFSDPVMRRPFALFGADGRLLAGFMPPHPAPRVFDEIYNFTSIAAGRKRITYRALAHRLPNGEVILAGDDIGGSDDLGEMIAHALLTGVMVMLVVGLGGAIVLGRSSARRIDGMRLAIERIRAGHLSERLPVDGGHDDLERLAGVVNAMLGELERMVGEVKGVCDNIAHDMRTPLARLLAGLERELRRGGDVAVLRAAMESAIAQIKEILQIFAALLRISEIEDGVRRSGFEPLDLVEIAHDAVDYHQPLAEARGIRLHLDAAPREMIEGDRGLLFEAIANLLDNAIKFSGEGRDVGLSIRPGPVMEVVDRGPGIPPGERLRVLERFKRGEAGRSLPGNGLGLPLVAAIVQLHGLRLDIEDAMPGCRVRLSPKLALAR